MFDVVLRLKIVDISAGDAEPRFALLERQLRLPFVPVAGLALTYPLEQPRTIKSVQWEIAHDRFVCALEDEHITLVPSDTPTFEEAVADAGTYDWQLVGAS